MGRGTTSLEAGRTKHVRMVMHAGIRALVQRTRTPPLIYGNNLQLINFPTFDGKNAINLVNFKGNCSGFIGKMPAHENLRNRAIYGNLRKLGWTVIGKGLLPTALALHVFKFGTRDTVPCPPAEQRRGLRACWDGRCSYRYAYCHAATPTRPWPQEGTHCFPDHTLHTPCTHHHSYKVYDECHHTSATTHHQS